MRLFYMNVNLRGECEHGYIPSLPQSFPVGAILPLYLKPGQQKPALPARWDYCDGSDLNHCPDFSGLFLRGANSQFAPGTKGGSETAPIPQFGNNNRTPDGNGWSVDGGHFRSNDSNVVLTVPPFVSILFIMRYQ
jgi:hypothetical protein